MSEMIRRPIARKTFNVIASSSELNRLIPNLPNEECYKIIAREISLLSALSAWLEIEQESKS